MAQWKSAILAGAAACALAACASEPEAVEEQPAATETAPAETTAPAAQEPAAADPYADWEGRWIGVEGMFADIQPNGDGTYTMEMQSDLDTLGTYQGVALEEGIGFERGGESFVLRAGSGEETGLKWLIDKEDCLVVREGEGYCRD